MIVKMATVVQKRSLREHLTKDLTISPHQCLTYNNLYQTNLR